MKLGRNNYTDNQPDMLILLIILFLMNKFFNRILDFMKLKLFFLRIILKNLDIN